MIKIIAGVEIPATGIAVDAEIIDAHPRDNFKHEFLATFHAGLRDRPDTAYGTVNADVLEHFEPGFRRISMVDRILQSPWAA
jgi:hypothetical protein